MNQRGLEKFIVYLQRENWLVFGPVESNENSGIEEKEISPYLAAHQPALQPKNTAGKTVLIEKINRPTDLVLDERLPVFPFKRFFLPENEKLFEYRGAKLKETKNAPKIAILGMNLLDLKAVNLYDQVFEKDAYYQKRRRNMLIVGHSILPAGRDNFFEEKFEEDVLEHLPFDIFLANAAISHQPSAISCKLFTGSLRGQRILEHFGCKDYTHVQFSGPVKENQPDERMNRLRDKLKNHHNQKIWETLGQRCIECGKCSIVCPTCFCFRIDDQADEKENGERQRCWDACFYQEFSETAGGHKFLNSTAQRIHFWYFHKFARLPDEFDFMGCVGCRRCSRVCPVGIDIAEVLKDIEK